MDDVERFHLLPQDGCRKAPATALYGFVNLLNTAANGDAKTVYLERGYKT